MLLDESASRNTCNVFKKIPRFAKNILKFFLRYILSLYVFELEKKSRRITEKKRTHPLLKVFLAMISFKLEERKRAGGGSCRAVLKFSFTPLFRSINMDAIQLSHSERLWLEKLGMEIISLVGAVATFHRLNKDMKYH